VNHFQIYSGKVTQLGSGSCAKYWKILAASQVVGRSVKLIQKHQFKLWLHEYKDQTH
jgi:hypothetical protein